MNPSRPSPRHAAYTTSSSASTDAHAHRTTPDIARGEEQRIDTSGEATNVRLAVGRTDGNSVELALAWNDGGGVQLATLTFTGSSFDVGAPSAVSPDDAEEIALGYASSGLVTPGFERNGATADESSSGGWLVAWRAGR